MKYLLSTTALILTSSLLTLSASANSPTAIAEDEVIVVTGMRVSQGGAQDINYFRGQVEQGEFPDANSFTSEGLLSEHDLILKSATPCAQTLCLNAETMATDASNLLGADYFMGLAFDTNIDQNTWTRAPLNLVAVIDKSGSMSGAPLKHAKDSLNAAIQQMRAGDQLSIVLYGSTVETHLAPTRITKRNKGDLKAAVNVISSQGSTYMEEGLKHGFALARETQQSFDGTTRLMVFTDERPNVGKTDAASFMAMAHAASADNIGMSTIGVGRQFGAQLANKVSSVRGSNLFFIRGPEDIKTLFGEGFDFMVSEVARDMTVRVTPSDGYTISGIYGVPQDTFKPVGNSVEMSIATTFLSQTGGGVFLSLSRDSSNAPAQTLLTDAPFASAQLRYTDSASQQRRIQTLKANITPQPSVNLIKASLLSQQYSALSQAATLFHDENDVAKAYEILANLSGIFDAANMDGLEGERDLIASLTETTAYLSGNTEAGLPGFVQLRQKWKIRGVEGSADLRRGDILEFGKDKFTIYRKNRSLTASDEIEYYDVNDDQVYLNDSALTLNYTFNKNGHLRLRHPRGEMYIRLSPYEDSAEQ